MTRHSPQLLLLLLLSVAAVTTQLLCPCNLVTDTCELSCCCDTDCNQQYKQLAFCRTPTVPRDILPSFLGHFLAVSIDNSPYLGLFYPQPINISSVRFDSLVSANQPYQSPLLSSYLPPDITVSYRYRDSLLSMTNNITHYLSYPVTGPSGTCVSSAVPYLHEMITVCTSSLPYSNTSSAVLSPVTLIPITSRYLCTDYMRWLSAYTTENVRGISLLNTSVFSECSVSNCSADNCQYGLLSSHRVVTWLREGITGIEDVIRLIRIPSNLSSPLLQQEHALTYKSNSSSALLPDTAATEGLTLGYVRGSDLLFGTFSETADFLFLSAGSIITSTNGYCTTVIPRNVQFLDNLYSGCSLTFQSTFNCTALQKDLLTFLNTLMNATHVARSRRASKTHQDHWVPILRPLSPPPNSSCHLPTHLSMRYLYSNTGAINSYQILEVVGASVVIEYTKIPDLLVMSASGVWGVSLYTSVEFVLVPTVPPSPLPRSSLRHTPICREPCYNPDQLLYPLYQSVYLQDSELTNELDSLNFSILLSIVLTVLVYRIVSIVFS